MASNKIFQEEEVMRLYADGYSITDIIDRLDISYDRTLRLLKQAGVYKGKRVANALVQKREVLRQSYPQRSKPWFYAGKKFDTFNHLNDYKKNLGHTIRVMYDKGQSRDQISKRYHLSMQSVGKFLGGK